MARPKRYNVSDGKLLLTLEEAEKGWYVVTSPMDPGITTQAKSISEAFVMARDAQRVLRRGRAKWYAMQRQRRQSA